MANFGVDRTLWGAEHQKATEPGQKQCGSGHGLTEIERVGIRVMLRASVERSERIRRHSDARYGPYDGSDECYDVVMNSVHASVEYEEGAALRAWLIDDGMYRNWLRDRFSDQYKTRIGTPFVWWPEEYSMHHAYVDRHVDGQAEGTGA